MNSIAISFLKGVHEFEGKPGETLVWIWRKENKEINVGNIFINSKVK